MFGTLHCRSHQRAWQLLPGVACSTLRMAGARGHEYREEGDGESPEKTFCLPWTSRELRRFIESGYQSFPLHAKCCILLDTGDTQRGPVISPRPLRLRQLSAPSAVF